MYWLRRMGSNHRPSGYEPDELPLLYSAIYHFAVQHPSFVFILAITITSNGIASIEMRCKGTAKK